MFMQVCSNCVQLIKATCWPQRAGAGPMAFGWAYWATTSVLGWLRERNAPPLSDIQATTLFLREELERRLERFRSVRRWFPILATVAIFSGYFLTFGGVSLISSGVVIAGGLFAIRLQCLESPKRIQGRIERMDVPFARRF
jgi:hypothetical protein